MGTTGVVLWECVGFEEARRESYERYSTYLVRFLGTGILMSSST